MNIVKKTRIIEVLVTLALLAALLVAATAIGAKLAYGAPRCHTHGTVTHCH